ncbi:hypothetical protein N0V85_009674, partial [Neurospora sp. IMI 360204]
VIPDWIVTPCLNEYEDNLPDPNPYDAIYNPVCGRRKLTREYKCPVCRADMHHRKCWCEVGACNLPSYDLLDGGVAESGGQWVPKMLHPGERNQEEIEVLEWVDHDPAVMDFETRLKLVELVNAVPTTMPEWEAVVEVGWAAAASENDDDDDDDDDELEQHETITHQKKSEKLNTRPVGINISSDADSNGKIYPIMLWNQAITPVCPKCDRERLLRFASAVFPVLEEMPDWFRHRGVQKTEK